MDAYTEIARLLGPRRVRPWIWSVVPKAVDRSAVGLGVSDSEARAREAVEGIMATYPGVAAFGALEGPATRERCLRTTAGTFTWVSCR
jgi:hypothetical protein